MILDNPALTQLNYPVALANLDSDGRVIQSNQHFEALVGTGSDAFLNASGAQSNEIRAYLTRCDSKGVTIYIRNTPRTNITVLLKAMRIENERYAAVLSDVTGFHELMECSGLAFDHVIAAAGELEEALAHAKAHDSDHADFYKKLERAYTMMRRDLDLARTLQMSLIPRIPKSDHWDISFYYRPMHGVSGDIIDFYTFGDIFFGDTEQEENLGIILLDASGHGISSALITAIARPILFGNHRLYKDDMLWKAMVDANVELCQAIGGVSNYLTGVSLRLTNHEFSYVNAGHPYILYKRTKTGKIHELENDGVLLGIPELKGNIKSRRTTVLTGDTLLLYSDGLTESENSKGEAFGVDRLKELLLNADGTAEDLKAQILHAATNFGIDMENLRDDLTFVIIVKK